MITWKIGQRVRLTADGVCQGLQGRARRPIGVIVDLMPRYLGRVKVQRYGLKTAMVYMSKFWEPIGEK